MSRSESSNWTIASLGQEVARTDRFAGGGAVAAMCLVGAAATAELVFRLSAGRRNVADDDLDRLNRAVEMCSEMRESFLLAVDADIASLTELMEAQSAARRERKTADGEVSQETKQRLERAVAHAIDAPLDAAREARRLLASIADLQHLSRTFTASDLGAAAATIGGAIRSLSLMAEVNLGMLESDDQRRILASNIEELLVETQKSESSIVQRTRKVIR